MNTDNLFFHVMVELGVFGWLAYAMFFYALHRQLRVLGRAAPDLRRLLYLPGRNLIAIILVLGLV